jgi:membrane protein
VGDPIDDDDDERGRAAVRPTDLGRRGFRDVLWRVLAAAGTDHVSLVAAGVAFFGMLAIFPAIAAAIAIWGLLVTPAEIERQIAATAAVFPREAVDLLQGQARSVARAGGAAGIAAVTGLVVALWISSRGMAALMEGLNIVYGERERRGLVRSNLMAVALTLGMLLLVAVALVLLTVPPALSRALELSSPWLAAAQWVRWPVLVVTAVLALAVVYRFAPSRREARWRWISWGAVVATLIWLAASWAFSLYVTNFANYNETYGALGGVVVLLLWLWLSALAVLFGAELNGEMERQTERDTTIGPPRPRGERGAHAADTVGPVP